MPGDMMRMTCTRHTCPLGSGGSPGSGAITSVGDDPGDSGGGSGEAPQPTATVQHAAAAIQGPRNQQGQIPKAQRTDRTGAL